jgi:hypothetical protein
VQQTHAAEAGEAVSLPTPSIPAPGQRWRVCEPLSLRLSRAREGQPGYPPPRGDDDELGLTRRREPEGLSRLPRGVTVEEARSLALSLPEAVERDHHGRRSFRIGGRIFATLWTEDRMNVMLDESGIRTAVERAPETCEPVWWGTRLAAVAVALSAVDRQFLGELLADAWEGKAPRRLLPDRRAGVDDKTL